MNKCDSCDIREATLVATQTAFQKHLDECSKGFYGRLAAKKCNEVEQLKKQIAELKKQISEQWVS